VPRRIHTSQVRAGELTLSDREAHHARDVLRLSTGEPVELFDDAGTVARGTIVACDARSVVVRVEEVAAEEATPAAIRLTLAAAVPKGDRADWMIEKLSELGVERFIPLATARSVVLPEGRNKRDRWTRIATEAAKQSQRRGVMRIDELTKLDVALGEAFDAGARWVLSTTGEAQSVIDLVARDAPPFGTAFIGPEGGWTDEELAGFVTRGAIAVQLTPTILRVETAAIAVAAIVGSVLSASLRESPRVP
jgi:16S rRNA (uracil1498-N3)-methyltransferase